MRILQRIWTDIRKGENIDLYITVTVALGLTLLNLVGSAPPDSLAPITLAVLGLLAITTLGNRYRIETLTQKLTKSNDSFFLEEFPNNIKEDFQSATDLWLIGVTLGTTIKNNYQQIEKKLRDGNSIRVLLVHPEGPGVEVAITRNYAHRDPERKGADIRNTLSYLCSLKKVAPDKMEIRTIQNSLGYGAIAINPDSTSGILYLENYPFRVVSAALPKFVLRSADGRWYDFYNGRWYDFYNKEIHLLWESASEWNCDNLE